MLAYEISKNEGAAPVFAGDLRQVRAIVRTIPKASRDWARIYLVDVATDKAAVLRLLNGQDLDRGRRRSFRLSVRGRLVELQEGEE